MSNKTYDTVTEAVVYGIESNGGLRGILVNGYGISSESLEGEMAKKLHIHKD